MPNQARRRLSSSEGPTSKAVIEANQFLKNHPLPRLLNRKRWTKKEWKRHKESWAELDEERKLEQRKRENIQRKMSGVAKRSRHHKVLRDLRKSERRERLDQRRGKKIRRGITEQEHSILILAALKGGATTVGQVCKKTGLATRDARRCLKTMVQNGDVEKPGSRQYQLPKQRKRLADVPTKRRRRLTKK